MPTFPDRIGVEFKGNKKIIALCKNEWINLLIFRYRFCFCDVAVGEQSEPVDYSVCYVYHPQSRYARLRLHLFL